MVGDPPNIIIGTALQQYIGFVDFIINMVGRMHAVWRAAAILDASKRRTCVYNADANHARQPSDAAAQRSACVLMIAGAWCHYGINPGDVPDPIHLQDNADGCVCVLIMAGMWLHGMSALTMHANSHAGVEVGHGQVR